MEIKYLNAALNFHAALKKNNSQFGGLSLTKIQVKVLAVIHNHPRCNRFEILKKFTSLNMGLSNNTLDKVLIHLIDTNMVNEGKPGRWRRLTITPLGAEVLRRIEKELTAMDKVEEEEN